MPDGDRINRIALLAAANACMFVFGVVLLLMGSLLPSLQLTYARSGNLGSLPVAGIFVSTVLVGPILDLIGAKKVFAAALALIAASLAVMSAVGAYSELTLAAFLYGLGGGGINTAANAVVADLSVTRRASALNLLGFFFSLGAVSAPLMLSSLGGNLSASFALRGLAILCLIITFAVLLLRFPSPAKAGTRLRSLLGVLAKPAVWIFAALLFFESGSENCMFVWSGKIVADALRVSPNRANVVLVALSAALGVGRVIAALFVKRVGGGRTIWLSSALVVLGSILMRSARQMPGMVAASFVIGLGLSAIFPTALGMASDRFPEQTGTVFGAIISVALIGGTAGPKIAGWIASYGIRQVLVIPIVAALAVALLTAIPGNSSRRTLFESSVAS